MSLGPPSRSARTIRKVLLTGTLETSLKKCKDNMEYRVTADAVESETFLLTILHPLVLKKTEATIVPLAYTRKETTKMNEGDFQVIEGSAVHFRFELDRPAQTGWMWVAVGSKEAGAKALPPVPLKIQGKTLEGTLANVTQDMQYEVQAKAADGTKLDPRRFHISVQPDRPPTIHFDKPPAALEALPTTEVTMQVSAKDDFGLAKVGIVFQIGDGPKETLLLEKDSRQPVSMTTLATLYLEQHKLSVQDGIIYYAFAEDNYPSSPHRVESDLQFIDIRAYKKEFGVGKAEGGKSVTLELLISRQRTNLQHTFGQCRDAKPDGRVAKRLAKSEQSLAKLTQKFSEELAKRVGWVPCLDKAVEAMKAAVAELEKASMKPACGKEELALAKLIEARENLRTLLANPKSGGEARSWTTKRNAICPRPKMDEDEENKPDENLQKKIEELAKTEETSQKTRGKSSQSGSNNHKPSQDSKSQSGSQSSSGQQSPENKESPKTKNSKPTINLRRANNLQGANSHKRTNSRKPVNNRRR